MPAPDYIPPSGRSLDDSRGVADAGLLEMQRTGAMAVQRAKEFLMGKDRGTVGEDTLGLLDDEVTRLVLAYPREPLSAIWNDLLATQEQVFRLLEGGRLKPSQLRDLNYKGAVLAFMVAKGFNDMQSPFQAMTMTRVAQACARDAEHDGLIALTDGLKSLISYWAHKPDAAYHFARKGAALTSPDRGTAGLWLLGLQARAAAVLGDAETVSELNRRATEQRDHVTPDGLDALGGLFTYSPAKQLYYTVESEALLGRGSAELATQAEAAVAAFSDRTSPDWAFGDLAGAQCDLAIVRLHGGDADQGPPGPASSSAGRLSPLGRPDRGWRPQTENRTSVSCSDTSTSPPHDAPTPTDNKSSTSTASQDHHEPDIAFAPNSPDRVGRAVVEDVEPGRGREPADTSRLAEIRGDLGLQLVVADADGAV